MTDKLPDGWTWSGAHLYAPTGCHAGEIYPSGDSKFYSHTWDVDGYGGENSIHTTLENAKAFVEAAILRQKFHFECDLNCSDDGDEEEAAEVAAELLRDLDVKGKVAVLKIVETMLGPKSLLKTSKRWTLTRRSESIRLAVILTQQAFRLRLLVVVMNCL